MKNIKLTLQVITFLAICNLLYVNLHFIKKQDGVLFAKSQTLKKVLKAKTNKDIVRHLNLYYKIEDKTLSFYQSITIHVFIILLLQSSTVVIQFFEKKKI